MNNFILLNGTYVDVGSIAYLDTITKAVILKGGHVMPNTTFTHMELQDIAKVIHKCNTVYEEDCLLFLSPQYVQDEIDKFCAFLQFSPDFKPVYQKPNDHIYKIVVGGENEFFGWVVYCEGSDSIDAVLTQVQTAFSWWEARNAEDQSDGGEEVKNEQE